MNILVHASVKLYTEIIIVLKVINGKKYTFRCRYGLGKIFLHAFRSHRYQTLGYAVYNHLHQINLQRSV
jgi:hypothetical protein